MEEALKEEPVQTTLETPPEGPQLQAETLPPDPPKRKRGRPRKQDIPEADVIPRKTKDGGKTEKEEKSSSNQTAEFFVQQLIGVHTLASLVTGLDLMIDPKGAASLGQAIYDVVKQYNLEFLNKFTPVMNLLVTTAIVEGPVILKAQHQMSQKKVQKKETQVLKAKTPSVETGEPLKAPVQETSGLGQAQPGFFKPQILQGGEGLGAVSLS